MPNQKSVKSPKSKKSALKPKSGSKPKSEKVNIKDEFIPDAYVVRTTDKNGLSRNNFSYPQEVGAMVECPDWMPTTECGNGLHGLTVC